MVDKDSNPRLLGIVHGFATWPHLLRAIIFVALSSGIVFGGIYFLLNVFAKNQLPAISYSTEGGLLIGVEGNEVQISYLPASRMWMDSGYELQPGDSVEIRASGRAYLALNRLFEAAANDDYPKYAWIGPDGKEAPERYAGDKVRDPYLIAENEPYGRLLMSPVQMKNIPPGKTNPRPRDGVVVVGSGHVFKNQSPNPVRLYFTVNDTFIDATSKEAYLLTEEQAKERLLQSHQYLREPTRDEIRDYLEKRKATWEKIYNNKNYWDLWFADNIGGYTIAIIPAGK